MRQISKVAIDAAATKHGAMMFSLPLARPAPKAIADFGKVSMGARSPVLPSARPRSLNR